MHNYALSLEYGSKYIYQTMPRLLTLWLDLGEDKAILLADQEGRVLYESRLSSLPDADVRSRTSKSNYFELQRIHFKMNSAVKSACSKIAVYKVGSLWKPRGARLITDAQWLTAFPQLVSRVEHGNQTVKAILIGLIVKVISAYPQQGLWSFISVRQSKNINRMKRGHEVLSQLLVSASAALVQKD